MKHDLAQLAFFVTWLVVLYRHQPLRDLVRAAPRTLTVSVGLLIAAWIAAQVTDQRMRFYPVTSVYMYGEYTPTPELSVVALSGRSCGGTQHRLDTGFLGSARVGSRLRLLYASLRYRKTASDSAAQWNLIDRVLLAVGQMHNRSFPDRALCSIGLDQISIPADQLERGSIPPSILVHDVPLR